MDFFSGQPRSILDSLLNILPFKVGISLQDFFELRTMCYLTHDDRDGDSHAPDAGPSPHDLGIKSDTIEHLLHLHEASLSCGDWSYTYLSRNNPYFMIYPAGHNAKKEVDPFRLRPSIFVRLQ
jgi:hypothetical protein